MACADRDPGMIWALLLAAGFWAGAQNALAGGGSFITLPTLILAGLDPRAANITSTAALFRGQVTTGLAGRSLVAGVGTLSFGTLLAISLVGGALGAGLLLVTPPAVFAAMVPWLVLIATGLFAWGSFGPKRAEGSVRIGAPTAALCQLGIAIYGGYFGGGIGFLMLAALTMAGLAVRHAGATKNALAAAMNASAVLIFALSPEVDWRKAAVLGTGAIGGGLVGAWMLKRVNDRLLKILVCIIGLALTVGLFVG